MEDNNMMRELNPEDLEQVSGGVIRTINTGTTDKAVIRNGPGKGYGQATSLINGTKVDTINDELVWDDVSGRHFVQVWYTDQRGQRQTGWIASSIVGMRR